MSQTFHVVSCVDCKKFQNHIVKRVSNKWTCKVCNTKQTLVQVFGEGTGAECRKIVQTLNLASGQVEESLNVAKAIAFAQEESDDNGHQDYHSEEQQSKVASQYQQGSSTNPSTSSLPLIVPPNRSKWSKYTADPDT